MQRLIQNVEQVIIGKRPVIELAVMSLLSQGHVLLEDVPGTGKTMLARALAKSINAEMKRIQFTPDLLPSDITGVPVYHQNTMQFEFRLGPVFTHILLADEINRATPRAQSALLECMEEFHVSVDGVTHALPEMFMVLATQNPIEMSGTHPLPEAQLDRFMMRLTVGYPSLDEELKILISQSATPPIEQLQPVITMQQVLEAREQVRKIHVEESVLRYVTSIAQATRTHPELKLGVSPRGALALVKAAKACAFLQGRDYVSPDMISRVVVPVLAHRMLLRLQAMATGMTSAQVLEQILKQTLPPV